MKKETTKATPGPWTIQGSHIIGYPEANISIAHILGHVGQPTKANARLIAAAPRMLEKLKEDVERFRFAAIRDPQQAGLWETAARECEAVINEAEGRE